MGCSIREFVKISSARRLKMPSWFAKFAAVREVMLASCDNWKIKAE
jgi:hypothetical protein